MSISGGLSEWCVGMIWQVLFGEIKWQHWEADQQKQLLKEQIRNAIGKLRRAPAVYTHCLSILTSLYSGEQESLMTQPKEK